MPNDQEYSISELADLAGVTPRTIRYYVSIGLLAPPGQVGPGTRYGDGHLQRLRLIRKLQREHLPLGEIGPRLQGLDDESVEEMLEADGGPGAHGSALSYIRQLKGGLAVSEPPAADFDFDRGAPKMRLMSAAPPVTKPGPLEPPPTSPTRRSQWDRVALSQNVELHIRRPLGRQEHKRVERLIRIGREILEDERS